MKKITKRELNRLINSGVAYDITTAQPSELIRKNTERIAVSRGKYGMNGGLLKNPNSGELYAITARNSTLFYYF